MVTDAASAATRGHITIRWCAQVQSFGIKPVATLVAMPNIAVSRTINPASTDSRARCFVRRRRLLSTVTPTLNQHVTNASLTRVDSKLEPKARKPNQISSALKRQPGQHPHLGRISSGTDIVQAHRRDG
jgi:hypothetical protein